MLGLVVVACLFSFEFLSVCEGLRMEEGRHGGGRRQTPGADPPLVNSAPSNARAEPHVWRSRLAHTMCHLLPTSVTALLSHTFPLDLCNPRVHPLITSVTHTYTHTQTTTATTQISPRVDMAGPISTLTTGHTRSLGFSARLCITPPLLTRDLQTRLH